MTFKSFNLSLDILIFNSHNLIISSQVILLFPGDQQLFIDIPQISFPFNSNNRLFSIPNLLRVLHVHKVSLLDQLLIKTPLE